MDPSPSAQPASESDDDNQALTAAALLAAGTQSRMRRRPAQRESVVGSLQSDNARGVTCGGVIGPGERLEEHGGVLPNPLPLPLSASASPSPVARTNGCGARVHASAHPARAGGRWVAPPEGASGVVVPLESTYFTPDAARMLELARAAGCGCAAHGVGCAVCGNALGALFTPCRTHTARSTGALRRQQHYVFLPGHVSPAIQEASTGSRHATTTPTHTDVTPRPPAVTLPPLTTLSIRHAGPSIESGVRLGGSFTIAPATLERFAAADAEVRQRLEAETARGDVDATPPVTAPTVTEPDTFMAMESPFRELYQLLRPVGERADGGSNAENQAVGPFGNAGAGWPEPPPPPPPGILPPLEIVAPRPPVMGAGPGPGDPAAAITDSQPLPLPGIQPSTGATPAAPNDGVEEMIEVLRMVAEMGTPVPPPAPAPAPAADRDRRAALRRLADEQGRMDRGTPGPVTGAMDREWDALRVRAARERVATARQNAGQEDIAADGEIAPWYTPTMPPERSEAPTWPPPRQFPGGGASVNSTAPGPRLLAAAHARRSRLTAVRAEGLPDAATSRAGVVQRRRADAGGRGVPVATGATTTVTLQPIASGPPAPAAPGDALDAAPPFNEREFMAAIRARYAAMNSARAAGLPHTTTAGPPVTTPPAAQAGTAAGSEGQSARHASPPFER
ncbi:hypothetical protein MIND_01160500 [Mycena indigotica]|uniref:Uncharacterized protein n=1 Tax=Mycena indigotica TaxID=2126181 RepID=A0A8H6S4G0_9AGAR|nr:uncharacterized protein MIND_01160500 [Mycena indigotica]KAF7292626.1 hypothetical protein MIND_01160500 [Mycena indigotica]